MSDIDELESTCKRLLKRSASDDIEWLEEKARHAEALIDESPREHKSRKLARQLQMEEETAAAASQALQGEPEYKEFIRLKCPRCTKSIQWGPEASGTGDSIHCPHCEQSSSGWATVPAGPAGGTNTNPSFNSTAIMELMPGVNFDFGGAPGQDSQLADADTQPLDTDTRSESDADLFVS